MSRQDPDPVATTADPEQLRLISVLVVFLGAGLFLALPFVLSIGAVVFLPLACALVLSIVLSPLADRLAGWGLPNVIASFLALAIAATVILALLSAILQPALDTIDRLPEMMRQVARQVAELRGDLSWLSDLNRQLLRLAGRTPAREVVLAGPSVLEQLAFATPIFVLEALLTALMSFFMIEARVRMRRRLLNNPNHPESGRKAARMIREVQDLVGAYMATVGIINLGVGVIVGLGAWAFGFEAPVMWGVLAALLNFLPYLGPLAMILVLSLVGLATTSDGLLAGLLPALFYLGLHTVEANLVTPALLGRRFTLNPVLILVSISYFYWIWGVIGALLAMPILLILTALFHHIGRPNLLGFLFGEPLFPAEEEAATS
jgi:predicted PurR-regulated permease PerM